MKSIKEKLEDIGLEITCQEEIDLYGMIYKEAQKEIIEKIIKYNNVCITLVEKELETLDKSNHNTLEYYGYAKGVKETRLDLNLFLKELSSK